jgi:hypothetical protein
MVLLVKFEAAERLEEKFKVVHNLLEYQADNEGKKQLHYKLITMF